MIFTEEVMARPTKEFAEAVGRRRKAGKEILSFGLGEPDFKTPQYVVDSMFKAIEDGYTHYCDAQGLIALRELIAKDISKNYSVDYSANEIAITPGIKSAAYSALTVVLQPGDKVGLCTPCYVAYPAMIKLAEPTAQIYDIDLNKDYSLNMVRLREIANCGIKCLIINSPNNPTGSMLKKEEVEEIIDICLKNDIYILSDEVYDKIVFNKNKHISFADYPQVKDRLLLANGYSKSHAMTGWRLGYLAAPNEICTKIAKLQFNTNTNVPTFIQKGACSIYEHEWDHITKYTEELEERMLYFHNNINSIDKLSGILPQGGFFYMVNIEETGMTSNAFAAKLVESTGIATTPGIAFGKTWDGYIRFSLAVPLKNIEQAISLIKEFMNSL